MIDGVMLLIFHDLELFLVQKNQWFPGRAVHNDRGINDRNN